MMTHEIIEMGTLRNDLSPRSRMGQVMTSGRCPHTESASPLAPPPPPPTVEHAAALNLAH